MGVSMHFVMSSLQLSKTSCSAFHNLTKPPGFLMGDGLVVTDSRDIGQTGTCCSKNYDCQ
jgi:hypothetical protein